MSSDHALILAVDGGGSKTDVALLQGDGELLSAVRGPGSSPEHLGLEKALAVVERVIEAVAADAGVTLGDGRRAEVGAFFMAGADLAEDERRLGTALEAHGWADRVHLANDGFALLWAATGGEFGIACAVGTGMNCVGTARGWAPGVVPGARGRDRGLGRRARHRAGGAGCGGPRRGPPGSGHRVERRHRVPLRLRHRHRGGGRGPEASHRPVPAPRAGPRRAPGRSTGRPRGRRHLRAPGRPRW